MSANVAPVFPLVPQIVFTTLTTQNTAYDGTGTVATVFTGGTNGSRADFITVTHLATNVATVLRIFINNGSTNATATNNALYAEYTIAAQTVGAAAASTFYKIPLDLLIPNGYKINVTVGTTVTGLKVICEGGDL